MCGSLFWEAVTRVSNGLNDSVYKSLEEIHYLRIQETP